MSGMMGATATATTTPWELTGASRIKWGALLGVLGLVMAIGGVVLVLTTLGLGGLSNLSNSQFTTLLNTILIGVLIIVASVFVALLSFVLYTAGFASLRNADGGFRTPMVLCIIGLIGLLLIAGFTIFYALAIHAALGCAASDTTCQNNATSLGPGIVPLAYLGGLLGFIGLIGGILGLWRFGKRYSNTLAKVGAILYIIPFAAVLAPILVLVGAHQIQKKLSNPAYMAPAMPPPMPVPPPPM